MQPLTAFKTQICPFDSRLFGQEGAVVVIDEQHKKNPLMFELETQSLFAGQELPTSGWQATAESEPKPPNGNYHVLKRN
jgi:hypothetical protein